MPNQPIFKEREENGIYTATLDGVTDNGVSINETWEWDINSAKENEIKRLSQLGLSIEVIMVHLKEYISKQKAEGIYILNDRFNKKTLEVST